MAEGVTVGSTVEVSLGDARVVGIESGACVVVEVGMEAVRALRTGAVGETGAIVGWLGASVIVAGETRVVEIDVWGAVPLLKIK